MRVRESHPGHTGEKAVPSPDQSTAKISSPKNLPCRKRNIDKLNVGITVAVNMSRVGFYSSKQKE